jgi:hypothetical protein
MLCRCVHQSDCGPRATIYSLALTRTSRIRLRRQPGVTERQHHGIRAQRSRCPYCAADAHGPRRKLHSMCALLFGRPPIYLQRRIRRSSQSQDERTAGAVRSRSQRMRQAASRARFLGVNRHRYHDAGASRAEWGLIWGAARTCNPADKNSEFDRIQPAATSAPNHCELLGSRNDDDC